MEPGVALGGVEVQHDLEPLTGPPTRSLEVRQREVGDASQRVGPRDLRSPRVLGLLVRVAFVEELIAGPAQRELEDGPVVEARVDAHLPPTVVVGPEGHLTLALRLRLL